MFIYNLQHKYICDIMITLKTQIQEINEWWTTGKINLYYKDRTIYSEIKEYFKYKQIICLTGLRRVGKTTLLKKIINDYLEQNFDNHNIIYFSFEEYKDIDIRDILQEYKDLFLINKLTEKYLLILDEIQKLKDWENKVKAIYDQYPNIKIIITGSESTFIRTRSKETLAGRMFEFKINPLSFKEFISFKEKQFDNLNLYSQELKLLFLEYLKTQGFPELLDFKDEIAIKRYLVDNIIDKTINDIIKQYKIKNIDLLYKLSHIILEDPGRIIDTDSISRDLQVSRNSVSNYLIYLQDGFFLKKIYTYSNNQRTSERKQKKYYPFIISPELTFSLDPVVVSKAFESLIVTQLDSKFFWRDKYKHEIDVLLIKDKNPIPIEIKFGKIDAYDSIKAFLRKYKQNELTVITFEKEETIKLDKYTIKLIPAYKYFLEN